MRRLPLTILIWALALGMGITSVPAKRGEGQPEFVRVQHILIGFKRTVPEKKIERTKKQAEALALELFERAKKGEEFDALVKEYTDDQYPGIYSLTNWDTPLREGAYKRDDMAPYFGDVAFGLEVGEVGLARYRPGMSPYGWHIIKRLE